MELAFLVRLAHWPLLYKRLIKGSDFKWVLLQFSSNLHAHENLHRTLFKSSASCPRRTVIHPVLICPSVCELWFLLLVTLCLSLCHCFARFMLLCCVLLCSAVLVLDGLPFNHDLLSFCLFPSFLSFPDLHIHSSYLLHLPFLHWEWQAGIPLTNSVFCTQQTPVRTLRGQSSARHLPPCVCMCVCERYSSCVSCLSPLGFVWPWCVLCQSSTQVSAARCWFASLIQLIKVNLKYHS